MNNEAIHIVSQGGTPDKIKDFLLNSYHLIKQENFQSALKQLRKIQELLQSLANQAIFIDPDIVIASLSTIALCHQRLGKYKQCAAYLDGCTFNSKPPTALMGDPSKKSLQQQSALKIRKLRLQCKFQLQLAAVLSLSNEHQLALSHARNAVNFSQKLSLEAQIACNKLLKKMRLIKSKPNAQQAYLTRSLNTLQYLHKKTLNKNSQSFKRLPKLQTRNILGVHNYHDSILEFSMGDLMQIEILTVEELKTSPQLILEFSKELMFEKIFIVVASFFSMGVQFGCMSAKQKTPFESESKVWLQRAENLAKDLLPVNSVFLIHIAQTYKRNRRRSRSKSPVPHKKGKKTPRKKTGQRPKKVPKNTLERHVSRSQQASSNESIELEKEPNLNLSFDVEDFRENFVISSNALYGEDEISEEEKYEHFSFKAPDRRLDIISSTGGNK